jgi:hypothetical protein
VAIFTSPWFYALIITNSVPPPKNGDFALKTPFFQTKHQKTFQNETKK